MARKPNSSSSNTLTQLQGDVVLPSTLGYKERAELRIQEACEYSRIYNHSSTRGMSVYDRLTADADVRNNLRSIKAASRQRDSSSFAAAAAAAAAEVAAYQAAGMSRSSNGGGGGGTGTTMAGLAHGQHKARSGFVSNNNPHLSTKQQEADAACSVDPPLSALHPITMRSYFKKFPLDFLAAARPQARTTNETLRMLGSYRGDELVAARLGLLLPHGSGAGASLLPAAAAAAAAAVPGVDQP